MPSIFRVYTGADGQSHLAEEPLALQSFVDSEGAYGEGTPLQGATGITFRLAPPGYILSWDGGTGWPRGRAPRRRPDRPGPHHPRRGH
jgi:hypothetical protein